ncbi:MAG: hypothetical protein M3400_13370 [Actinomycetota bacterium]|nr:hypothetical protein [Actinomycetota bacterium]
MASTLPLARTNAEAHIYMDLHPCECGTGNFHRASSVIEVDGDLASRYAGICRGCAKMREFIFALPENIMLPGPGKVFFGDGSPSQLIDPGEWMFVADRYARVAPANTTPGTEEARTARHQVATAAAAMDEVLAFVPEGGDAVPYEAIRSERGRKVYDEQPGRFYADRITVVRDTYRQIIDELDAATP